MRVQVYNITFLSLLILILSIQTTSQTNTLTCNLNRSLFVLNRLGYIDSDREINLTPLAINDSSLIISEVLFEGQIYANYNPTSRILNLPAGIGGHFTVTYQPVITNIIPENIIVAERFELMQNYPNPFNPITNIKYTIPNVTLSEVEGSRVQLKVFDILGNAITTLVDEYKPAGSYEVEFNASTLTSGVYFYHFKAGEFMSVKKMILLK